MQIKYLFFSNRLGFRLWKSADTSVLAALSSDSEVMKFFPAKFWLNTTSAQIYIEKLNEHYDSHGFTYFAVDLLETSQCIGFIGLKTINYHAFFTPAVDIGWRLAKQFWGKGYATEGAVRCANWFFESFEEDRFVSITPIQNSASENVMRKIGMIKVDEFNHPLLKESDPLARHVLYEMRAGDQYKLDAENLRIP